MGAIQESTGERQFGRESARVLYVAVCVGLGLLVFNCCTHYSIVDDAYITYRYVDNWLSGHGLVFNPGERVEGYTSLLWVLLVAPFRAVGVSPEVGSTILSILALILILGAVKRTATHATSSDGAGWCALILAAGSLQLARWAGSGMEAVFFAALLALANERLAARREHNAASSILFGLSVLARPPGALHALVAFAVGLTRIRHRGKDLSRLAWTAALFLLLPLIQLCVRLVYYGVALPNTYYAKLSGGTKSLVPNGLDYLGEFLFSDGGLLILCAAFVVLFVRRLPWIVAVLLGQILVHGAYVVWIGGDFFPFHRFLVPVIPGLAVLGGIAIDALGRALGRRASRLSPVAAAMVALMQSVVGKMCPEQEGFERAQ